MRHLKTYKAKEERQHSQQHTRTRGGRAQGKEKEKEKEEENKKEKGKEERNRRGRDEIKDLEPIKERKRQKQEVITVEAAQWEVVAPPDNDGFFTEELDFWPNEVCWGIGERIGLLGKNGEKKKKQWFVNGFVGMFVLFLLILCSCYLAEKDRGRAEQMEGSDEEGRKKNSNRNLDHQRLRAHLFDR